MQVLGGGSVRVLKSLPGKYVFSHLILPRLKDGGTATAPQRILAVDDDTTIPEVLTFFLGRAYEVTLATTGIEALVKLRREPVDLVVLDHRLPDRTGLEILGEVRSVRPELPIVMLTGYGSEWLCAAAFKLGVADYLPKPVSAVDLVRVVKQILSPRRKEGGSPCESPVVGDVPSPLCDSIQRVVELIQERYWEQLSLSELARQVGMSKYHLSHRFREVLGVTFRDYILRTRLERAKALLAAGRISVTEVAQVVGFGDLPRFDKVFKRHTGCTPSAYRSLALDRQRVAR
jgi:two-component system response regulator YesN